MEKDEISKKRQIIFASWITVISMVTALVFFILKESNTNEVNTNTQPIENTLRVIEKSINFIINKK